ncbi:MAG: aminotransferase class III-fold pyridoxal phosphate-dependent enzyme [Gemmataceae bacterium]|nr:aminotransferase class III-fold pyridoxal phosphate-dependent enzyme [Gemmataceae bacterium]
MTASIHHANESTSNTDRDLVARFEPKSLRTFTPSQAVLAKSAGVYHWTPEGRKLYDFSSGVLVANLGHNPSPWMREFAAYMGWTGMPWQSLSGEFFSALPLTAYNAITPIETQASKRLAELLLSRPGGKRLQHVMWAASGSEAIQKALWAALARDRTREMIVATRFGFHGKKGLAGAVTGSEADHDRDPRVRFISFPMKECIDVSLRDQPFDPSPYRQELEALKQQFGRKISVLITEPYIGGGGSYHPHKAYLQMLQAFCRENDIIFILDEVQSNFGRTGDLFAFETYGLEPDIVVLGKGLGNGVPVAAAVGLSALFNALDYGEGSDTWSANPLCCAAVLATLDEFARTPVLEACRRSSAVLEKGLLKLKELPFVAHVRGEKGGMVWGVEMRDHGGQTAAEWANAVVLACYRGEGNVGIHLLGPLAKKVVRISPPLVITEVEAQQSLELMHRLLAGLVAVPKARTAEAVLA